MSLPSCIELCGAGREQRGGQRHTRDSMGVGGCTVQYSTVQYSTVRAEKDTRCVHSLRSSATADIRHPIERLSSAAPAGSALTPPHRSTAQHSTSHFFRTHSHYTRFDGSPICASFTQLLAAYRSTAELEATPLTLPFRHGIARPRDRAGLLRSARCMQHCAQLSAGHRA